MGRDKAAIDYHDMPQSRYCLALLAPFCAQVFLSNRAEQADDPGHAGLPQIHDRYLGIGPLGGVLSAFETDPKAAWLVLACDMPRVDSRVIRTLLAGRNPQKHATAYRMAAGFFEPLCAVYEPAALPSLQAAMRAGQTGLRHILETLAVQAISPDDERLLGSINSSGDDSPCGIIG